MNRRFWHTTKIFQDFDRNIQEELTNTDLAFDVAEKRRRAERKRVIPFYNSGQNFAQSYYDPNFYENALTLTEFEEICQTLLKFRDEITDNRSQLKTLAVAKKIIKYCFGSIPLASLMFYFSFRGLSVFTNCLYLGALTVFSIAIVVTFVSSVLVLSTIPKLGMCINPSFSKLEAYISKLNGTLKEKQMNFHFDVQQMQIEVSKM